MTVQEFLLSRLDLSKVIDLYIKKLGSDKNPTDKQKQNVKYRLLKLMVVEIIIPPIEPENEKWTVYIKKIEGGHDSYALEAGDDSRYDYLLDDRKDLIGYKFVPCEEFTPEENAAFLLWELTWFGFDYRTQNRRRKKELKELKKSVRQAVRSKTKLRPWKEVKAELEESLRSDKNERKNSFYKRRH